MALIRLILLLEQILIEEKILDNDYAVIIAEKHLDVPKKKFRINR